MHLLPRPIFSSKAEYARYFTRLDFWQPYIENICAAQQLEHQQIGDAIPGTNVVFRLDDRYVVKIFPELFDGAEAFAAEQTIYELLAAYPAIACPKLIAQGKLFDSAGGWPWPYIITTAIPGQAVSASQLSQAERLSMAAWAARQLHMLHQIAPRPGPGSRFQVGWQSFDSFIAEQRRSANQQHRDWQSLPEHLIAQLDSYLLPEHAQYIRHADPIVLHADLHADHVLGQPQPGGWRPTGLIDFDDARSGDLAYELPPIFLSLFARDKALLQHFLDSYGLSSQQQSALRKRAMHMTLLHEFNVLDDVWEQDPALMQLETLEELERALWGQ